jgi:hypothetical protein
MNIKYFVSERFQEQSSSQSKKSGSDAFACSLNIVKTFVEKVNHPYVLGDENMIDLLRTIVNLKVRRS